MNDFPYPKIQSFERLQVSDGLMINSERWRLAHEYHHLICLNNGFSVQNQAD